MPTDWINALLGGLLIGVSVSLMLYWNGRVTGISGIINGLLSAKREDVLWRLTFLAGLFCGGLMIHMISPQLLENTLRTPFWTTILAGGLVGFGTVMGSGCTSGHGVCGISRLSLRSLIATITFIISGVFTVFLLRSFGVLS